MVKIRRIDYMVPTLNEKSYEEHREHFIFRLKERYSIEITNDEYDLFCTFDYKQANYQGKFLKGAYRSVGILKILGIDILVLHYSNYGGCYTTALPQSNLESPEALIQSCFPRSIRHLAYYILNIVLSELKAAKMDFGSDKEMALYYLENNLFSTLLIEQYKWGKVDNFAIMRQIGNLFSGKSKHLELTIKKIKNA